jgi:hypothetical protein
LESVAKSFRDAAIAATESSAEHSDSEKTQFVSDTESRFSLEREQSAITNSDEAFMSQASSDRGQDALTNSDDDIMSSPRSERAQEAFTNSDEDYNYLQFLEPIIKDTDALKRVLDCLRSKKDPSKLARVRTVTLEKVTEFGLNESEEELVYRVLGFIRRNCKENPLLRRHIAWWLGASNTEPGADAKQEQHVSKAILKGANELRGS